MRSALGMFEIHLEQWSSRMTVSHPRGHLPASDTWGVIMTGGEGAMGVDGGQDTANILVARTPCHLLQNDNRAL